MNTPASVEASTLACCLWPPREAWSISDSATTPEGASLVKSSSEPLLQCCDQYLVLFCFPKLNAKVAMRHANNFDQELDGTQHHERVGGP